MNREFYKLSSRFVSTTIQVGLVGLKPAENLYELNYDNRLFMGDYENCSFPIAFKQEYGRKWQDILDTGFPQLFLISDNIKKAFQENNLTGWYRVTGRMRTRETRWSPLGMPIDTGDARGKRG